MEGRQLRTNADILSHRNMPETQHTLALRLLESRGIMRLAELRQAGVHSETLARMVAAGAVLRQPRGLYRLPGVGFTYLCETLDMLVLK